MTMLKIPFALNIDKQLVRAADSEKGFAYVCPVCQGALTLRKGSIRVPYFAHFPDAVCNKETYTHRVAKLLIQKAVREAHAGTAPPPIIERECELCFGTVTEPLPGKLEDAALEVKLDCGHIVDVALLAEGKPRAAVEILVTHSVDEEKAQNLSVPFIELDGDAVVKEPLFWKALQSKSRKMTICGECRDGFKMFQDKACKVALSAGIELPESYYRYGLCPCWGCKRDILVFTYPGHAENPATTPFHLPAPTHLQWTFSKTEGKPYWMNICPFCQAKQGDFFLFNQWNGPFHAFACGEDTKKGFAEDMLKLSYHARVLAGMGMSTWLHQ